jgi:CDGSH-type Zn-finger protein
MARIITSFLLLLASTNGFQTPHKSRHISSPLYGKINDKIDLASKKVVNNEQLCSGDKKVYCRCWKSDTFPLCDGAHVAHNKETGDNVGPLILSTDKAEVASVDSTSNVDVSEKTSVLAKIIKFMGFGSDKNKDGLTMRERLSKMGLLALLSYGWVSNMSYAVTLSLSWYGFSKKVSCEYKNVYV